LTYPESPTLFLEFHGTEAGVAEQAELFSARSPRNAAAASSSGPPNPEHRTELWKARHNAYWAALQLRPGAKGISTDVCVPISRLAECVAETQEDIAAAGLIAPIVGHAGDGNFHVLVLIDTDVTRPRSSRRRGLRRAAQCACAGDGRHLHR
jgi:D-lactate dehydrogenase (cytochrome)